MIADVGQGLGQGEIQEYPVVGAQGVDVPAVVHQRLEVGVGALEGSDQGQLIE